MMYLEWWWFCMIFRVGFFSPVLAGSHFWREPPVQWCPVLTFEANLQFGSGPGSSQFKTLGFGFFKNKFLGRVRFRTGFSSTYLGIAQNWILFYFFLLLALYHQSNVATSTSSAPKPTNYF